MMTKGSKLLLGALRKAVKNCNKIIADCEEIGDNATAQSVMKDKENYLRLIEKVKNPEISVMSYQ